LLGEILWSLYARSVDDAKVRGREQGLRGTDYLESVFTVTLNAIVRSPQMQRFMRQDPEAGLRVLMSGSSRLQDRTIGTWESLVAEETALGEISPQLDAASLAYFIVRIGQASAYGGLISGRPPGLEPAGVALRLLLAPARA
jgi:hypothetical protein